VAMRAPGSALGVGVGKARRREGRRGLVRERGPMFTTHSGDSFAWPVVKAADARPAGPQARRELSPTPTLTAIKDVTGETQGPLSKCSGAADRARGRR
jgi:hypothetical protein